MTRIDLARLDDITSGIPNGTSFPGSPSTDDLFHRTDRDLIYFYDGTRWLTTTLYRSDFGIAATLAPTTTNLTIGRMTPWHTTYDLWMETFYSSIWPDTTNDGSKFWTVTLRKDVVAWNSPSTIASFTTAAQTVNNWATRATAIGALLTPATYPIIEVTVTKTSTPGAIYWSGLSLAYRLVG